MVAPVGDLHQPGGRKKIAHRFIGGITGEDLPSPARDEREMHLTPESIGYLVSPPQGQIGATDPTRRGRQSLPSLAGLAFVCAIPTAESVGYFLSPSGLGWRGMPPSIRLDRLDWGSGFGGSRVLILIAIHILHPVLFQENFELLSKSRSPVVFTLPLNLFDRVLHAGNANSEGAIALLPFETPTLRNGVMNPLGGVSFE